MRRLRSLDEDKAASGASRTWTAIRASDLRLCPVRSNSEARRRHTRCGIGNRQRPHSTHGQSKMDQTPSVIGADVTVVGTLSTSGDVTVDGTVRGDIQAKGRVTISEQGKL